MRVRKFLTLAAVVLLIGALMTCGTQAWGTTWYKFKDCNQFGHINQHSLDRSPGDWLGNVACAPTATMNSFIYLQNHYPTIYDHSLVPVGQEVQKARELALNWMGTTGAGTSYEGMVWGKYNFLEHYAPGKTMYEGQTAYNGWTGLLPRPGWVQSVIPNWNFLFNQLNRCQDVEIGIQWGTSEGHALTVCGFQWDDVLNTGKIWYVDPWTGVCTPIDQGIPMWMNNGYMWFNYSGANSWIDLTLAESVPEPSALLMLGSACIGLLFSVKRRRA